MPLLRKLFFTLFYLRKPPWDTNQSPPELLAFLADHPAGRALDLGCGTGTNVITLAQHGWEVIGVDFVRKPISLARKKAARAGVRAEFRLEDVTRLRGIRGPFDLILDIGCYHSLAPKGQQAYRRNIHRLLASGGTFLLYAFIKPGGREAGSGLTEADVDQLAHELNLVDRQDGTDRGRIHSVWLTFRKDDH